MFCPKTEDTYVLKVPCSAQKNCIFVNIKDIHLCVYWAELPPLTPVDSVPALLSDRTLAGVDTLQLWLLPLSCGKEDQ